jgi:hypothetical protein
VIGVKNSYIYIIDWLRAYITKIMAEASFSTVGVGDDKHARVDVDLVEGGGESAFITASSSALSDGDGDGNTGVKPAGATAGTVNGASADERMKHAHAASTSGKMITTGEIYLARANLSSGRPRPSHIG